MRHHPTDPAGTQLTELAIAKAVDRRRRSPRSVSARQYARPVTATTTTDCSAAAARRFAVACGVLSQYVKAAGPVPMPMSPSRNMAHVGAVQQPDGPQADRVAQQLTIFYGGRVVVLEGCTPARAAELIRYATAAAASPVATLVDMPIARKASLQRFLSKRKDRSVGRWEETAAPAAKKKGKRGPSSWLALGSS